MNTPPQGNLTTIAQLRAALEETAAALAAADLDRLLAADTTLQSALTALPASEIFRLRAEATVTAEDRQLLRQELEGASAALRRCRRLGAGLSDFTRVSLEVRGEQL